MVLPEVDPTDDTGADVRNVSQPERRLLFAILSDALVRCRRAATAPRHVARQLIEAERWIRSDDREWPCSFVNVCEALDIAHGPLRRAVLQWRKRNDGRTRVTRRGLLVKKPRRRRAPSTPVANAGETESGSVSSAPALAASAPSGAASD
jgi:hypothetical protein